jgi:PPM family protein phosphatase
MKVIPGNAQDIGARESQQDAFGFSSSGDAAFEDHGGFMMVLCDGMGGLANGAAASTAAVNAVLAGYQRKLPLEPIPDALNRVINEAHRAVCEVSGEGGLAGTTVVAAVVWRDQLYWGSLGDSRLYLCRSNEPAWQLTEDHNVGALIRARGQRGSSRRETAVLKDQEALTAYLGAPTPPPSHVGRHGIRLEPGDRVVACSDGLYRGLGREAIAEISRSAGPMRAAERLVQAVLDQQLPHQDNVTVALFEVVPEQRSLFSAPRRVLLGRALPVTAGFGAGVVVTSLLFLVVIPTVTGPSSPVVPLPPAAVTQSVPADTPRANPPGTATTPASGTDVPSVDKAEPRSATPTPPPAKSPPNGAGPGSSLSAPASAREGSDASGPSGTLSRSDNPAALPLPPEPPAIPLRAGPKEAIGSTQFPSAEGGR